MLPSSTHTILTRILFLIASNLLLQLVHLLLGTILPHPRNGRGLAQRIRVRLLTNGTHRALIMPDRLETSSQTTDRNYTTSIKMHESKPHIHHLSIWERQRITQYLKFMEQCLRMSISSKKETSIKKDNRNP